MRIEELSVGDWVAYNGKKYRIKEISSPYASVTLWGNNEQRDESIVLIEPIPLTAEILEKNGFEKTAICTTYLYNSDIEITLYGDGWWRTIGLDEYSLYRLDGVHQLQHALRLAGIEKEIEV